MNKNKIPRNFYGIKAKILIDTSGGKAGDVWNISKNDSGYLGLNTRTQKFFYLFPAMIRDGNICEIIEIIK